MRETCFRYYTNKFNLNNKNFAAHTNKHDSVLKDIESINQNSELYPFVESASDFKIRIRKICLYLWPCYC